MKLRTTLMRVTDVADMYALSIARRLGDAPRVDRFQRLVRRVGVPALLAACRKVRGIRTTESAADHVIALCEARLAGGEPHAE